MGENGILDIMRFIAEVNEFDFDSSKTYEEQNIRVDDFCTNKRLRNGRSLTAKVKIGGGYVIYCSPRDFCPDIRAVRQKRSISVCPDIPDITDSASWKIFKHDLAGMA